jgi:hypothetical protein
MAQRSIGASVGRVRCYPRVVATLTSDQVDLLGWMIESGPGRFMLFGTYAEPETLVAPNSENRDVDGSDVRELVGLGLLREVGESAYEVTNDGRALRAHLTNPPPERPKFGFHKT